MSEKERFDYLIKKGFTATNDGLLITNRNRIIGFLDDHKYYTSTIYINKKRYVIKNHRFIWYYFNNNLPEQIDHIDGSRCNNKLENLRASNNQLNHFNETKAKGYTWDKSYEKWQAKITLDGKTIYLGRYDKEDDARNAYLEAKKIYHKTVVPV